MTLIKNILDEKGNFGHIAVYAYATEEISKTDKAISQLKIHINDLGKLTGAPSYYNEKIKILKNALAEIERQLKIISRSIN